MGVFGNYLPSNFRIKLYVNTNPDLTDELSSVSELLVWALQLQHPEYYEMWEKNCRANYLHDSFNNSKCLIFYFIYCKPFSLTFQIICNTSVMHVQKNLLKHQECSHYQLFFWGSVQYRVKGTETVFICFCLPGNGRCFQQTCAYVHMQTTKLHSITWQFYAKEETVKDLVNRAAGVCEKESMGINQRDLF